MTIPLLEARNVSKAFGGVHAVENVSMSIMPGEVVALLGHNGAGKSTFIKMLSGVFPADGGEILIDGKNVDIRSPHDAQELGIETIHQTLALADNLDAVSNLFLGRERTDRFGFLDVEAMEHGARQTIERMRLRIPSLDASVRSMSGGQRQAVAIARALHFNARILIMDEPTAALGPEETKNVGVLIDELKRHGLGILLISHDMHDVLTLSDRITVMKSGRVVGSFPTRDLTQDDALEMIILGRKPARFAATAV
ncbi:ATP-binding cassette domain-containing protein [Rhizobium sp. BK251]|uniref:ATP-binding cassette domain-containing protein n=1 Tax=Rhizobium sp. BK251 TaxID=2512125 RepID=UPI00104CFD32|nr:ATP-binding cassette domain-containing protein [Rhizobium sp. BK251]TCL64100.1 monosaccharide ABC transporter ATP-binding protein (CUT2 family) [Rhizobium sp. BK251]